MTNTKTMMQMHILRGEEINNYVNLISTNKHYSVELPNPELCVVHGLLDVIQELSKYRRRMHYVLDATNFFNVYSAGFYVGHLRAGRVGSSHGCSYIFGSPEHSRPRAPQGLAYNEEYSASIKTAAKKASELFVPAKISTIIQKVANRVRGIFGDENSENSVSDAAVTRHLNSWKVVLYKGDSVYRNDERLLRTILFYALDAHRKEANDDWDAPESANGAAELDEMFAKFAEREQYMDAYRKMVRNKARYEKMTNGGVIMYVNAIGKPTLIMRSDRPGHTLKVPFVIHSDIEKVEHLPENIQTAYHALRMAGLYTYVENTGMFISKGTENTIEDRILGSCVWLDPEVFVDYGMTSLS